MTSLLYETTSDTFHISEKSSGIGIEDPGLSLSYTHLCDLGQVTYSCFLSVKRE